MLGTRDGELRQPHVATAQAHAPVESSTGRTLALVAVPGQEPGSRWDPRSWSLGRHMGFYAAPLNAGEDARCVHCPSCEAPRLPIQLGALQVAYCLLCSQMWDVSGQSHDNKSCLEFDAALPQSNRSKERHWAT